ncbi:hypothetical protein PMIN01_11744 [Paraphaeosphaeria minitans]|uniref:Myb-like domain-containing protein n=1 Tax=Paraphaeosphaeria minitans TaxID=565426 RepID=A0A9P6G732_9PLEO|nr:hypothetical protein PMIN01_11744 [Paraphaeosphaeria minitans]
MGTAEHSRTGIDCRDGEERLQVDDDVAMLDWNASQYTHHEAADAPNSAGYVGAFRGASELENPERDQFGEQSLDEGQFHLAMIRLLSGTSRDFPLVVEGDAAEERHSATGVEPSNVTDSQEGGQPTSTGNEEDIAVQHSDLDTDEVRTLSTEEIESARPNSPLAQDELLFGDVDVTDRPSATRKRTHSEALDVMPELELEDTRSTKRRKLAELLAESLGRIQVPTPRSTPLQVPSGGDFHSRTSTEPSSGPLDHGSKCDGAGTPRSSASDLHTGDDVSDGAPSRSTGEALMHSSRGPVSRSEEIPGEHYVSPDSERIGENREGSGGEHGESHDESNWDDVLLPRTSAKASRRRERSNRPLEGKRHSPPRTILGRRGSSTMPRASRQIAPSVVGPEDVGRRKRRKAVRKTGNARLDLAPAPEPMPLSVTSSGSLSRCGASNERSPSPLDSGSPITGPGNQFSSLQNLEKGGDDGAHTCRIADELLQSPRQSVTYIEGRKSDQDILPGSETPAAYGTDRGSGDEVEEGHFGERGRVDVFDRSLQETAQQSKYRGHRKVRSPSRPSLRCFRRTRTPASTLPSIVSPRIHQPSMPRTGSAFQTCSPQRHSPESKASGSHNRMGAKMAYQITDLTHIQVPKGSSVVTMNVRCTESNLPLYPIALHHGLFGSEGKVIRMTQLSPDSWMLVGYRSEDMAPSACSRKNPTLLNIGRASISLGGSASDDNDGSSEKVEDEVCEDHVARTRALWLESDEMRLLSLKDVQRMKWEDVLKCFLERTPGAVKARYYASRKKDLRGLSWSPVGIPHYAKKQSRPF